MQNNNDVNSLAALMELEARISTEIQKHPLDSLLLGLRAIQQQKPHPNGGIPPHVIGVAARFATRFGVPGPMTTSASPVSRAAIDAILRLVADFAHADPCAWIGKTSDPILPLLLRIVGNQFPYHINIPGKWGRAEIMFNELAGAINGKNAVPNFDFHCRFKDLTGVTFSQFIDIGYLTYAAAKASNQLGFTRGYFEKARQDGFAIPDDNTLRKVLAPYAADSTIHAQLSEKYKQKDRNYAAYDFNSLFVHPLIRPWPLGSGDEMELDRMVAPLPDLVLYRMTNGVYLDMHDKYKEDFDEFFGHLLSAYVGRILSGFVQSSDLISEDDVRKTYSASVGKVPDWIIVDRKTAILIEVKVARIPRLVYATGDLKKLDEALEKVRDGLRQMFEFQCAVTQRKAGLERFSRCKEFINVIVTFEQTYLASSEPFNDRLRALLDAPMRSMNWAMLSLDDLEWFQVHLSDHSIDIASAFRLSLRSRPDDVVNNLAKLSGRKFSHSMLCGKEEELSRRLGVPDG